MLDNKFFFHLIDAFRECSLLFLEEILKTAASIRNENNKIPMKISILMLEKLSEGVVCLARSSK